jgi:hypothetical protein
MSLNGDLAYEVFGNFRQETTQNYIPNIDQGHGTAGKSKLK